MALTKVTTGTIADDSIQSLKNRNLVINGAMQVAQRGTQAGQGASNTYSAVDRFEIVNSGTKTARVTSSKQATTTGEFSSQFKIDCTTAQASVASGDLFAFRQKIEGQNLQHLQYGTSSAKTLTATFTITSPKSGIHCVQLHNRDASYSYVREFTVDAANTAQIISVTFPGYTATALDNDNNSSLELAFPLIAGSDWQTTKDGWTSGNDFATSNQQNLLDSTANDFLITGIQLELGDVATPFEHRSYGQEFALCQRYYEKSGTSLYIGMAFGFPNTTGVVRNYTSFNTVKRATPTMTYSSVSTNWSAYNISVNINGFSNECATSVATTDPRPSFSFVADAEL